MIKALKIGPLNILISGDEKYVELTSTEFIIREGHDDYDIKINIVSDTINSDYVPTHFSGKGSMNFNSKTFHVEHDPFYTYDVSNLFNENKIEINLYLKKASMGRELFRVLNSLRSVEYATRTEFVNAQYTTYSFLWSIIAIALLKKNSAFIHAGVLARNNDAIILSGTGGCGKTSTVLDLLENHNFEYLSEDFGIVSSTGNASHCNKTISLFNSDIAHGNKLAKHAVTTLPFYKKVRWEFLTRVLRINPIIKAKPSSFKTVEIPDKSVKIKYGLHLSRQNVSDLSLNKMELTEYVSRSANASGRELKPLSEVLKLISANAPFDYGYWDDSKLTREMEKTYLKAFNNIEIFELVIPHKATPKSVSEFLLNELDI